MNKISIFAAAALSVAAVFAQDAAKPDCAQKGEGPHGHRPAFMPNSGIWVAKMLSKPEIIGKIGVTDAETKAKIAGKLTELDVRGMEIERKIRELSIAQAELFKAILSDKSADQKPLLDKIDEIAELRAEQGRLAVEALVFLRDNLSQEQIDKAVEIVEGRSRERGMMRGPSPFDGDRGKMRRGKPKGHDRHDGEGRPKRRPAPQDDEAPAGQPVEE